MKIFNIVYNQFIFGLVKSYINLRKGDLEILGPLKYPTHSRLIDNAIDFHHENTIYRSSYLYSDVQRKLERDLNLNQRSTHFILRENNNIVCYLRLTPYPFEVTKLISNIAFDLSDYKNYYEFSRFCTDHKVVRKKLYAKILLLSAGRWLFTQTHAEGIVGLCKWNRLSYFKLFNLNPIHENELEAHGRPGKYFLVGGKKQTVLFAIANFLIAKINYSYYKGKFHEFRTIKKHS